MPLGETYLEVKQVRAFELDLFGRDERSRGDIVKGIDLT